MPILFFILTGHIVQITFFVANGLLAILCVNGVCMLSSVCTYDVLMKFCIRIYVFIIYFIWRQYSHKGFSLTALILYL